MPNFADSLSDIYYVTEMDDASRALLVAHGLYLHRTPENIAVDTFYVADAYGHEVARYSNKLGKILIPSFQEMLGLTAMAPSAAELGSGVGHLTVTRFKQFVQELGAFITKYTGEEALTLTGPTWALTLHPKNMYVEASKRAGSFWVSRLTWKQSFAVVQQFPDWQSTEVQLLLEHDLPALAIEGMRAGLHPKILREMYGVPDD